MRLFYFSLAAICCGIIIWQGSRIFTGHTFPIIPAGFYQGNVTGMSSAEPERQYRFFLHSSGVVDQTYRVNLTILESEWTNLVFEVKLDQSENSVKSLALNQNAKQILFWGNQAGQDTKFEGEFRIKLDQLSGSWTLAKVLPEAVDQAAFNQEQLNHSALMRNELSVVQVELEQERQKLAAAIKQTSRLSEFVTNPESLKKHAEERLEQAMTKQQELEDQVVKLKKQVAEQEEQVKLAYKVTQQGTLVALARESLEREGRWVESMFRSKVGDEREDLSDNLTKATQVAELRRQINEERNLLFQLRIAEEYAR